MDAARRLALGQWFTPPAVADLALALVLPRPLPGRLRVLDPACGDGVFLERARAAGVSPGGVVGVELDPKTAAAARQRVAGVAVQAADLFDLEPGEYDVVVGNPPYVRQERLGQPAKERIRARLRADWPELAAVVDGLVGRGDLAVACAARALRMLRPGGRMALVVSSALLDAGYAAPLWRLLSERGRVLAVVEAPAERWFADAAVNAMILVAERTDRSGGAVPIARLRVPTAEAARALASGGELSEVATVRVGPAADPGAWAAAARAPDVWFQVQEAAAGALVPLGDLAAIRRGITSGDNEFFYLDRGRAAALGLEAEVLRPLVGSPRTREAARIAIDPDAAERLAFVAPADLGAHPAARRYVEANAHRAARPTLRVRPCWWQLPARPARLFLTKAYAGRFVQRFAPEPVVADQRVYAIHPRPGIDVEQLAAVLNTTWTALALESLGRASMGEGALEWTVADAHRLPVFDPRRLDSGATGAVARAFRILAQRPIGDAAAEADRPDRRVLDLAAAPAALAPLLPAAHEGLVASAENRAARARR